MCTEHKWNHNEKGKTKYAKINVPLHLHPHRQEINICIVCKPTITKTVATRYFGFIPNKIKFFWDRHRVNWQSVTHISELEMLWSWRQQAPPQQQQLTN